MAGSSGLGDKHSPLSCSIHSLSPSINGSSSGTALDLLHPTGSATSGGPEGAPSGSSISSGNSTTPTVVIPLSPGSAGYRGSDPGAHEFLSGAQDLIGRLTAGLRALTHERERLKMVVETAVETSSLSSRGQAPNSAINTGIKKIPPVLADELAGIWIIIPGVNYRSRPVKEKSPYLANF